MALLLVLVVFVALAAAGLSSVLKYFAGSLPLWLRVLASALLPALVAVGIIGANAVPELNRTIVLVLLGVMALLAMVVGWPIAWMFSRSAKSADHGIETFR